MTAPQISIILLLIPVVFLLYALAQSLIEKEVRASIIIFMAVSVYLAFVLGLAVIDTQLSKSLLQDFALLVYSGLVLLLMPWPKRRWNWNRGYPDQIDERNIMFSRAELEPGTEKFEKYYREFPEHLEADNKFRASAGLLSAKSTFYHPWMFRAAEAAFFAVESFHSRTDGETNPNPPNGDIRGISLFLKKWASDMGCHSIGVTTLEKHHLYKTGGRKHNYNEEVKNRHKFAIAFTVEMDFERVKSAPRGPIIMESSTQYLRAGAVAVQIASFLRSMGYSSKAHIDGKYQVRCVEVANDAGIGEIGRMGILLTPRLGPRVRIGVVTTDFPFIVDSQKKDRSMLQFCRKCKKCANTCPASAISREDPAEKGGAIQWTVNQEACFSYWCRIGTDCGRCISVCPYSHPDNFLHNVVRRFIKTSPLFLLLAVKLDDFLYGKKPAARDLPGWMKSE